MAAVGRKFWNLHGNQGKTQSPTVIFPNISHMPLVQNVLKRKGGQMICYQLSPSFLTHTSIVSRIASNALDFNIFLTVDEA